VAELSLAGRIILRHAPPEVVKIARRETPLRVYAIALDSFPNLADQLALLSPIFWQDQWHLVHAGGS
jgi:hypothetical protein